MEEIKKYLEKKKKKLLDRQFVLIGSIGIRSIFHGGKNAVVIEWEKELEVLKVENEELKRMLADLKNYTAHNPNSTQINEAYQNLSILLVDEIERRTSSLDVQENEMFARLRISELEFAHSQLKSSLWTFESQRYL